MKSVFLEKSFPELIKIASMTIIPPKKSWRFHALKIDFKKVLKKRGQGTGEAK